MIGYDSAFIGTTLALPSFVDEFKLDEMSKGKLALTKANMKFLRLDGSMAQKARAAVLDVAGNVLGVRWSIGLGRVE